MSDKARKYFEEYTRLQHSMQAGVQAMSQLNPQSVDSPKHLRVGINTALSEIGALGRLLIAKGVLTEDEYWAAMTEAMQTEVDSYKKLVGEAMGVPPERINLV